MLLGTCLQRHISLAHKMSILPVPVLKGDIEVSCCVGEVQVPNLEGKAEGRIRSQADAGRRWVFVLDDLCGSSDGREVERAEYHVGKTYHYSDDNA